MRTKHKRLWLEPKNHNVMSYMAYTITDGRPQAELDVDLQIADCNRKIGIWFSASDSGKEKFHRFYNFLTELGQKMKWLDPPN